MTYVHPDLLDEIEAVTLGWDEKPPLLRGPVVVIEEEAVAVPDPPKRTEYVREPSANETPRWRVRERIKAELRRNPGCSSADISRRLIRSGLDVSALKVDAYLQHMARVGVVRGVRLSPRDAYRAGGARVLWELAA